MAFFSFQNMNFHYERKGEGTPVLFLHGLGGDLKQCQVMLEHVPVCRVTMDVRGHGETPLGPVVQLNFDQFAKDAKALMQYLGIQRFLVGGISMGSGIALNLGLAFPEYVTALILIRPAWLNISYPENLKEHVMIGRLLRDQSLDQAKCLFMGSPEYSILKRSAPAVASSLLGQFDSPLAKKHAERLVRIPASTPFTDLSDLAGIQADTLILSTDHDPAHPLVIAQELASRIPGSRFVTVTSKSDDGDKHFSECSWHINEFLKNTQNA